MNLEKNLGNEINKTINRYTTTGLRTEPRPYWRDTNVLIVVPLY